jgi:outer membrane protein OmpA-like peptidoglycan-associated protein
MQRYINYAITALLLAGCCALQAQQANTLYFMQGVPERNAYNPAFQPIHDFYLDLPVLPNFRLDAGNNSLAFNDVIFNNGDSTITFLHPDALDKRADFMKRLHNTTRLNADFTFNILGFGFRTNIGYFSFDISEKFESSLYLPKDFFRMLVEGNLKSGSNIDLKKLGVNASLYTEVGVGYSRIINEKLTVGAKLKYLIGQANVHTDFKKFSLTPGSAEWRLEGDGTLYTSLPLTTIPTKLDGTLDFDNIDFDAGQIKAGDIMTSNWGLGIDLGATYNILPQLQLSAAITDLGFIRWSKNLNNFSVKDDITIEGVKYVVGDKLGDIGDHFNDQLEKFKDVFKQDDSNAKKAYSTRLSTRLNVGAEYSFLENKIGVGLLSSTLFTNNGVYENLTASANFRPTDWLSPSVSYSLLDGRFSTIGFGARIHAAIFDMYMAIDRIPLKFVKETSNNIPIPSSMTGTTIQVGWVWTIGNPNSKKNRDDDNDGVKNKFDRCPDTPLGYMVDQYGCTVDTDGDGVPDNLDRCPDTPLGVVVDIFGCPLDGDGDGVPDYLDKCPDTPKNILVDSIGCPLDSDGDGVPDYLDKCPDTPSAAYGMIDEHGCPKDSDGDGVPDYRDQCPDTPAAAHGMVDEKGCPLDSDGDGIPDYIDNCPKLAGPESNQGCPEIKAEVTEIFRNALQGIQFQSGKATIKATSNAILNKVVQVMNENPEYHLEINGHTDNVGKPELNMLLSQKRADAVKAYLVKKGVSESRINAQGFGDTKPVDTNSTAQGRSKNRRVELTATLIKTN